MSEGNVAPIREGKVCKKVLSVALQGKENFRHHNLATRLILKWDLTAM
jgi:hypothetical protein